MQKTCRHPKSTAGGLSGMKSAAQGTFKMQYAMQVGKWGCSEIHQSGTTGLAAMNGKGLCYHRAIDSFSVPFVLSAPPVSGRSRILKSAGIQA